MEREKTAARVVRRIMSSEHDQGLRARERHQFRESVILSTSWFVAKRGCFLETPCLSLTAEFDPLGDDGVKTIPFSFLLLSRMSEYLVDPYLVEV